MTYWALNAVFLAVVAVVGIVAVVVLVRRTGAGTTSTTSAAHTTSTTSTTGTTGTRRTLAAGAIGLGVLLVTTAVFDNIMIAVGLVAYAPDRISGAFLGIAPLEDFAYAIAAAVLLPSLWVLLEPRRQNESRQNESPQEVSR